MYLALILFRIPATLYAGKWALHEYIIFLIFAQTIECVYLIEPPP